MSDSDWWAGRLANRAAAMRGLLVVGLLTATSFAAGGVQAQTANGEGEPIVLVKQGSFSAGGSMVGDENASQHCDHGFVEYQIPQDAKQTALFMWHSSSTAAFQNRWDGGEGFQSIFLRRGYPVYLWDGPRVGRADWGCEEYTYMPQSPQAGAETLGRDQVNFVIGWRLGPSYLKFFPEVQFPRGDKEAWNQATRSRYNEFDTTANAMLQADAAAAAIDRIGPTVAITSSAGGFRAMLTRLKTDNLRGIYSYETPGVVFPEGEVPEGVTLDGPYGSVAVPLKEFKKLTEIPIVIAFGDNVDKVEFWVAARTLAGHFVEAVNRHGGNAKLVQLTEEGLVGNTHVPSADMNNAEVADLVESWLAENDLQ